MPIADVLSITISVSGAGPTKAGFGEPLVFGVNAPFAPGVVREYSTAAGMISDGFLVTDPTYLCASQVFAQNPSPPFLKVGRRAFAPTQILKMTMLSTSALDVYTFSLRTPGGSYQVVTVPSTGVPSTDVVTIRTAVTALAIPNLTATSATTILTLTMAVGKLLDVKPDTIAKMSFADASTDPGTTVGLAQDLANLLATDSAWYGLLLDSQSPAEIALAAVWAEANGKLFIYNSSDTACSNAASTTDVFYLEKALLHARSAGLYSQTELLSYSAAAWMGRLFPTVAGSENWAFKTLSGVPVDNLTDSQVHAVENKNASVYSPLFGLNLTQFGKQPSGQWIDVTRGTDAVKSDLQVAVLALQANSLKVPMTDAGVDLYRAAISGVLGQYVATGFLAANPPFFVSLPLVANISVTDRANRNLPLTSFTANLAGAINSAQLTGTLSP
jgi:hypothetical protein